MMVRTVFRYTALTGLVGVVLSVAYIAYLLQASLPSLDGAFTLDGLGAPAQVEYDEHGIPRVHAHSREDTFCVLGFVTARDRLFQMDLLRRNSGGRLAEIFGPELQQSDRWHRVMGFEQVAEAIFTSLPEDQQQALRAYARGVNAAIAQTKSLPFEFLILGYEPPAWRVEDSLLVVLGLYETLSWSGDDERTATVMEAALSPRAAAFFTPDSDWYAESLLGARLPDRQPRPIPIEDLRTALSARSETATLADLVRVPMTNRGSNAWLVAPAKSRDRHAILANDMHLDLGVPNIWYRAELQYGDTGLAGLTLPGVPLLISGTNHKIAWGFTNIDGGDLVDLVLLDPDTRDSGKYRTPQGTQRFTERVEKIHVRGAPDESLVVRTTIWGPVLPDTLLDRPVAVRWTALDPVATNLDLLNLDRSSSVVDAVSLINRAGGPPLNALVADHHGDIGWSYSGRIPLRVGLDGLISRSWADGTRRWEGYIAPDDLPRTINPFSGFLVNANQKMLEREYPYVIGHNFESGYRAYRITERLREMQDITEQDMLALQLDTQTEFYRYYQRLALQALAATRAIQGHSRWTELRHYLEVWDGRADTGSLGLALLAEFRQALADTVLSPLFARCREIDPKFQYAWSTLDVPLQRLLDARLPELLPQRQAYADWDAFIVAMLDRSARRLMERYHIDRLEELSWGQVNVVRISHPLSKAIPLSSAWLDMPAEPLPGCDKCVRWSGWHSGASERLVVAPGHETEGILHMPGGQSGHPLSPFFRDQQPDWVQGLSTSLLAGATQHRLTLHPGTAH